MAETDGRNLSRPSDGDGDVGDQAWMKLNELLEYYDCYDLRDIVICEEDPPGVGASRSPARLPYRVIGL